MTDNSLKRAFAYCLSFIFCIMAMITVSPGAAAYGGHFSDVSIILKEEITDSYSGMTFDKKRTVFNTGDEFVSYRIVSAHTGAAEPFTFSIRGGNGKAIYYDAKKDEWITVPLEGKLPDAALFIETDEEHVFLGPAVIYKPHDDGNLQDIGMHGAVTAFSSGTNYSVRISLAFEEGTEAYLWMLKSAGPLVEWDENAKSTWKRLDFNGDHRICHDGAYYISPSTYVPSGEGMYCRIPAVHPVLVLIDEPSRIAAELSIVLLEEAIARQNDEGYWETPAESLWLMEDYGIPAGFYDTRFNNDVTMRLFSAYLRLGDERYLEAALRQTDWLVRYARENSFPAGDGVLVEDYGGTGIVKTSRTHCSLNHLLQEIKVLLTAEELTGNAGYGELAELMLEGIRDTEHLWISDEKGLHYSIGPDMTAGGRDYPYLTYNDLYDVQEMLEVRRGRDPSLDRLMASKLRHMLEIGIRGYREYSLRDTPPALRAVLYGYMNIRANPGRQRIEVDGTAYDLGTYVIEGENYVRLRDLAAILDGTDSRFGIVYDEETQTILLEPGKGYTRLGNELQVREGMPSVVRFSAQEAAIGERKLRLTGFLIDGSNYYRLRDLGAELGFRVDWDPATRTVFVRTRP